MTMRCHLRYADELDDARVHVLQRFSFRTKDFVIASMIRSAFADSRISSGSRLQCRITRIP